jgi:phosphoglycerate dehydrogenase-like enzyme
MTKPRIAVLVNESSAATIGLDEALKRLRRSAVVCRKRLESIDEKSALSVLRHADGVITSWESPRLGETLLDAAPNLRIVAHAAGSVRPVVSDAVWRRKIVVTSEAATIAESVAEFSLGRIIAGLGRTVESARRIREDGWWQCRKTGLRLADATVGIVGAGLVGKRVVRLLKRLGGTVLVYDPYLSRSAAQRMGARKTGLATLFRQSDAVSLHAPSLPQTRHMVNGKMLSLLKAGAVLVNTARGSLVDERALVAATRSGRIFAFLDVTDPEPPAPDSPLRTCAHVLLTPHIAGLAGTRHVGDTAVTEIERFFTGRTPRHRVTKRMLERIA